jgi:hypothetical protein
MAYKNDSVQTIMGRYGKASDAVQTEMYETWDAIRHMAVSGNALGGSGLGAFNSFLMNIARMFGSPAFSPILGSQAISIPGTQYYAPFSGGTGIVPGGQSSFGLAQFSQATSFPSLGGAAPVSGLNGLGDLGLFSQLGAGSGLFDFGGVGDYNFPSTGFIGGAAAGIDGISSYGSSFTPTMGRVAGGQVVGGALGDAFGGIGAVGTVAATGAGMATGLGLGRNWLMPTASALSGIGGLLTTLGPLFGPIGLAGVAAGGLLNGTAGAILSGFQQTNQRVLANADTVHEEKLRHLDVTKKMLGAQSEILKKMLKEAYDGDKKALENL